MSKEDTYKGEYSTFKIILAQCLVCWGILIAGFCMSHKLVDFILMGAFSLIGVVWVWQTIMAYIDYRKAYYDYIIENL
jgi:hypothetical protein